MNDTVPHLEKSILPIMCLTLTSYRKRKLLGWWQARSTARARSVAPLPPSAQWLQMTASNAPFSRARRCTSSFSAWVSDLHHADDCLYLILNYQFDSLVQNYCNYLILHAVKLYNGHNILWIDDDGHDRGHLNLRISNYTQYN